MHITVNGQKSTEISDNVIKHILNLYPEEDLENRVIFQDAFSSGLIDYNALKNESNKILVPWQLFLLNEQSLIEQIDHIEKERHYKVSNRLMTKRKGSGSITSKRIIDRLIRQQNYLVDSNSMPNNPFCGSLKGMTVLQAVNHIREYFKLDMAKIWSLKNKTVALEYYIERVEKRNVNVSRGVLTNGILPYLESSRDVYRNTSGFAIKDDRIPFIFLPSEINPDEVESRQIYTLVYLLVIIGLGQYEYFLESDFISKLLQANKSEKKLHQITTEVLMPEHEIAVLKHVKVDQEVRDKWSKRLKVSPTAFITTLLIRELITEEEYKKLLPVPFEPVKKSNRSIRSPRISTSARKFCGHHSYSAISLGIRNGTLANTQAQYLLFGSINKKRFRTFRNELGI